MATDDERQLKLREAAGVPSGGENRISLGESVDQLIAAFEDAGNLDDAGNEFWFARDLQRLLG